METDAKRVWHDLLGLLAVAILSATLAIWAFNSLRQASDFFSLEDGRRMEANLSARIGAAELGLARVEAWRGEFSLQRQDLPNRLARIEVMLESNSAMLADIRKRLDSLEATRLDARLEPKQ